MDALFAPHRASAGVHDVPLYGFVTGGYTPRR
jgi:hypothetical protein